MTTFVIALLIALVIAGIVQEMSGDTEVWPHPKDGEENPYKNWKE